MFVLALAPALRVLRNREAVYQTQPVRESPEDKAGSLKVSEFPRTVQGGGIVIRCDSGYASCPCGASRERRGGLSSAHSQFIADTVCLLRCDFTGIESHSYLVKEHVRFLFLPPPTYRSLIAAFASRNSSVTVAESHS